MTDIQRTIAELEQKRYEIRAQSTGRLQTEQERREIRQLTKALAEAWEERRMEQARSWRTPHELVLITELKERTV